MTALRVTDLEKFALEQIWRPYWPTYQNTPCGGQRLLSIPFDLDETALELSMQTEWRDRVIVRLARIGVTFPEYVQHPLATIIRELLADPRTLEMVERDGVKA